MSNIVFKSEKDLEDLVFKMLNEKNEKLCSLIPDFKLVKRQLFMDSYGTADIVTFNPFNYLANIIELKNVEINIEHIFQALRYKTFLARITNFEKYNDDVIAITMIGPSINLNSDVIFSYVQNIKLITFKIDENGIIFEKNQFVRTKVSEKVIEEVNLIEDELCKLNIDNYECKYDYEENDEMCLDCPVKEECKKIKRR